MQFVIQDTGMGIAPEHLPYIFDPFIKPTRPEEGARAVPGWGLL